MAIKKEAPRSIESIVSSSYQWLGTTRVRTPFGAVKGDGMGPFLALRHAGPAFVKGGAHPFSHPLPGEESGVLTYLLEGVHEYRDGKSSLNRLRAGDLHWTWGSRAGGAWVLPESGKATEVALHGIQVGISLPAPIPLPTGYRCMRAGQIPKVNLGNATIGVLAGTWLRKRAPLAGGASLRVLHVAFAPNTIVSIPVPAGQCAAAYVIRGFVSFTPEKMEAYTGDLVRFGDKGQVVTLRSPGTGKAAVLLLSYATPPGLTFTMTTPQDRKPSNCSTVSSRPWSKMGW